jgi:hypothetical protein
MSAAFSERLKIYASADCAGNATKCGGFASSLSYVATTTGWHTVIADGASSTFEDWGPYTLGITVTAGPNACDCP